MTGSRYSQCHDESMEEHVPPSPLHSGKKRPAEMLVFSYILEKFILEGNFPILLKFGGINPRIGRIHAKNGGQSGF